MKKAFATIIYCAFIAACTETTTQESSAGATTAQQTSSASKEKVFECAKAAGIKSQLAVETTLSGGHFTHRVLPKNGVTQSQADSANKCIIG